MHLLSICYTLVWAECPSHAACVHGPPLSFLCISLYLLIWIFLLHFILHSKVSDGRSRLCSFGMLQLFREYYFNRNINTGGGPSLLDSIPLYRWKLCLICDLTCISGIYRKTKLFSELRKHTQCWCCVLSRYKCVIRTVRTKPYRF